MTRKITMLALGFAAASAACSSNSDTGGTTIGGNPQGGASGASGTNGGGAGNALVVGTGGNNGGPPADACQSTDIAKEALPVDMYIMFDQSSSMSATVPNSNPPISWWTTAQQAVVSFVGNSQAAGIGVGLQFFPFKGYTDPSSQGGAPDPSSPTSSCNIANYQTPEVEVGLLPGNSGALIQSINSHAPTTFTPTSAALQGAIQHMQQWGPAHPGRQPVVVLVTDGYPTECAPQDPSLIADIAKQANQGTPRILTFVVGFETGGGLDNLNQVAKAGGTGSAFLIKGGDIGQQFVTAMLGISTTPLSCDFTVATLSDPSQQIDYKSVWVQYVPAATGIGQVIPKLDNMGQCGPNTDGWFFDAPPPNAKKIIVCPETCSKFAAGSMHIKYGCVQTGGMH